MRGALLLLVVGGACAAAGVVNPPPALPPPPTPTTATPLRTLVESRNLHIRIGTAIGSYFGRTDAIGAQYAAIAAREFNVVTPENELKFSLLRPDRATFRFARPDSMLAFATANNMKLRGHTLVFGNQLSSWLTNGTWTKAEGATLLDEHISTTVSHYKGQIAWWDVVNEVLNENGSLKMTFWSTLIGRSHVEQAFRTANAADPAAQLFYNDYNIETAGPKSDSLFEMVKDFKTRGVPIHGIGFQAHFIAGQAPTYSALVSNFSRFAALGLRIHITELDVRIALPTTAQSLQAQAQTYADTFKACLDTPACDMVVMWGFTDLSSWIPNAFPGTGAALLLDATFQPKPAYTSVNDLLGRS
jgi:endo-1,4-beta-xylanase